MRQTTTYALSFKLQRETCKIDPRSTGMIVFNNAFSENHEYVCVLPCRRSVGNGSVSRI